MKPGTKKTGAKAASAKSERKTSRAKAVSKSSASGSSREKVRAHRKRMRAKGLRLVQIWLPDTRSPHFAARAHRDSVAIARSPTEQADQAFVDSISWWNSAESRE